MPKIGRSSAWTALKTGNDSFVAGRAEHPSQSIDRSDSRVAAEIIFDQGLGDMIVVPAAGHVLDSAVLGSVEYAMPVLSVPLVVVLGHDRCGAVKATLSAVDDLRHRGACRPNR